METKKNITSTKNNLGAVGEDLACSYLSKKGFLIVSRNFHSRYGELDIVGKKENLLAIVEVKSRTKEYFPISSVVTFSKQLKIIKTTKHFLQKNNEMSSSSFVVRFDLIIVSVDKGSISHIENAFYGS
jgi:putative endonuclease